jgi:hypothetical protein
VTLAADAIENDRHRRPSGQRKSSIFPVSNFGTAYFNADDRAAELKGGLMEIQLTPEEQTQLMEVAQRVGKNVEDIARDAIKSFLIDSLRCFDC